MMTECNPRLVSSLKSVSQAASATAMLVGCLVLVGWIFDIATLKSVLPGLVTMKVNTAVAFLLAGVSLWLLRRDAPDPRKRLSAQVCALTVALVGLLTLGEYLLHWDLGIDQFLFQETMGAVGTSHPGRMAPNTALAFLLVGCALLLLDVETRRGHRPTQFLTLMAAPIALVALFGYACDLQSLYGIGSYRQTAFPTVLTFIVLSVGLLFARPDRGVMAVVTSDGAGGVMARRLLPAAIGIPSVLEWLRLEGQRAGLYGTEFGVAMHVVSTIILLGLLIYAYARSLNRTDAERKRVEKELDHIFTLSLDMFCIAGFDGYFKRLNPAWEKTLGFTREELLAKPNIEFVHPEDREATTAEVQKLTTGAETISFDNRYLCKDGSYKWLSWNTTPLVEQQSLYAVARDVTEHKRVEEELARNAAALARANAELAAINKELEAFTYSVSHDLRAPLRHVDGFSKILLEEYGAQLDPTAQGFMQRVREGVQQMGRLVDDLLNLGRVSRQELSWQMTGLNSLVEEIRRDLKSETEGRQIEWQIGRLPFVECDPGLMKQVFSNLLSNALKFTRPRERAVIQVDQTMLDGQPAVFVRDNGVGFSMKYADKLFGVFQRLHRQEDFEGTGVGLALVQRIIHKHGGCVWAEAELDKGATFYFTLAATTNGESATKPTTPEGGQR